MKEPTLEFRDVDQSRWDDLVRLFEARGGPKSCWCMVWRATTAEAKCPDGRSRKAALGSRVLRGLPVGILAYCDGAPVAWCSIAPRSTYRRLGGPDDYPEDGNAVWSIVCFFIKRELRGRRVSDRLLAAAIAHARSRGASIVEAYPVDPNAPSYRFMGFVDLFRRFGFEEIGTAGTRRHVVRLSLTLQTGSASRHRPRPRSSSLPAASCRPPGRQPRRRG
jgi:GNAT superfamily N-acetyltransferase